MATWNIHFQCQWIFVAHTICPRWLCSNNGSLRRSDNSNVRIQSVSIACALTARRLELYANSRFPICRVQLIPRWITYLDDHPGFMEDGQTAWALQMYSDGGGGAAGAAMVSARQFRHESENDGSLKFSLYSLSCGYHIDHRPCFRPIKSTHRYLIKLAPEEERLHPCVSPSTSISNHLLMDIRPYHFHTHRRRYSIKTIIIITSVHWGLMRHYHQHIHSYYCHHYISHTA